jgi:hypothetical protein
MRYGYAVLPQHLQDISFAPKLRERQYVALAIAANVDAHNLVAPLHVSEPRRPPAYLPGHRSDPTAYQALDANAQLFFVARWSSFGGHQKLYRNCAPTAAHNTKPAAIKFLTAETLSLIINLFP